MYAGFYSTTTAAKIRTLDNLRGFQTVNVEELLNDIADGCGGCESAQYSTDFGTMHVSVLSEMTDRPLYVAFIVDELGTFVWHVLVGIAVLKGECEDSPVMYSQVCQWALDVLGSYEPEELAEFGLLPIVV